MPKYSVFSRYSAAKGKDYPNSYCVSDSASCNEKDERPDAAIFPVNDCYDAETHRRRAHKFCNYLNAINDVMIDLENEQNI